LQVLLSADRAAGDAYPMGNGVHAGAVSRSGRSNRRLAGQAAGKYTDTPKDNDPALIDAAPHFEVQVNQVNALKSSDSA
jgi:hypothetical protein